VFIIWLSDIRFTHHCRLIQTKYLPAKRYAPTDDGSILMVQPPGDCFYSANGGRLLRCCFDRTATLTSGLDFQHDVSYWCSIVAIALKCTVF